MQIPVIVESTACGHFRAQATLPLTSVAEGPTSEAALANLRAELNSELKSGKRIVMLEVPSEEMNPWIAMTGWLKDDPLFDEWQAAIEENRRQSDVDAGITPDERA